MRDLVKLLQEAKQREEEANQRAEHWHRAYRNINRDHLALQDGDLCSARKRVKEKIEAGDTFRLCQECPTVCESRKSLERNLEKAKPKTQILARVLRNITK